MATIKDANGNLTGNSYDGFNRLSKVNFPLTARAAGASDANDYEAYCYDPNDNRIALRKRSQGTAALTCPAGAGVATGAVSIAYAYDVLSRQTQKTFPAGGAANVAYAYDLAGRPLSALFANQAGTPGVTWSYYAAGRRIAEATNGRSLGFAWDAAGNPQSFTWPDGAQAIYVADAADRLTSIAAGGVSVAPGYDGLGRMTSVARGGTSTTIGFDPVDRVATLTHAFATTTANIAYTFGYTPASQVASAATSNTAYDWAGTSATTTNTTADGLNRDATIAAVGAPCAASGAVYDCNGNLTFDGVRTFSYDGENRLLTESGPVSLSLSYDPLGRLQQEVVNGAVTQFLYDGDALVAEYDGSGNLLRRCVHGPSADNPLIWFEGASVAAANASYLIADRQGSIVATANSAGAQTSLYAYDPYGGPTAWGGSRFRYTGQIEIPEAQLYYYKARVYDPASGRFLQTDPVGWGFDVNLYAYVRGDPLDAADPDGTAPMTYYPSYAEASLAATDDAVTAMAQVNRKVEFGTKILKNEHAYIYGPVVSGPRSADPNSEHWSIDKAMGSLGFFLKTGSFAEEVGTAHGHPWNNRLSGGDFNTNAWSAQAGTISNSVGIARINVPNTAAGKTELSPGNYTVHGNYGMSQRLVPVTVNKDGSATGHYEAQTGTRIGASVTCSKNPC